MQGLGVDQSNNYWTGEECTQNTLKIALGGERDTLNTSDVGWPRIADACCFRIIRFEGGCFGHWKSRIRTALRESFHSGSGVAAYIHKLNAKFAIQEGPDLWVSVQRGRVNLVWSMIYDGDGSQAPFYKAEIV